MRTKRRGFVFYLFLALLGLGPVAYCAVRFWGGWRLIDGGAAILFLPLAISVMLCSALALFVPAGEEGTRDPLAVPLAILCGISTVGVSACLFMQTYLGDMLVLSIVVSILLSLLLNGVSAATIITLLRRKRPYFLRITEGLTETDIDDILTSDDLDDEPDARDGSIFDTFDPTKDYYGKHGEFDKNDDSWGTSEYIRQFRNNDPDVDLSEHFDWQERAEAESDGFLDDD